jgi:hypothetical protein
MFRLFFADTTSGKAEIESFTYASVEAIKFEAKCLPEAREKVKEWARNAHPGDCLMYEDAGEQCVLVRVSEFVELVAKTEYSFVEVQ